jgi:hypothetical protein
MIALDDGTYKITWENTVNVSCGIRLDINAPKQRAAAESMLEKGLITEEEYAEIDTILLEKYRPYLGTLLSENA